MRASTKFAVPVCAGLVWLAAAPSADAVSDPTPPAQPMSCMVEASYYPSVRSSGFNGTTETSYQVAGPTTIDYTVTDTASQTFGVNASFSVSASALIASSEAKFGIDYSYTTSATKSWKYSTSIPSGQTGLMAVLHRQDRVTFTKQTLNANCSLTEQSAYATIPVAATSNLDYCVIRDLYPYGYSTWRSGCFGE